MNISPELNTLDITATDIVTPVTLTNGVQLELVSNGRWFRGIRGAWKGDVQLRNSTECIVPEIATPDGWEIDGYELLDMSISPDRIIVKTRPYFRVAHRMEWTEHSLHRRINPASWSRGPATAEGAELSWIIEEASACYDGIKYDGFSYQFFYCAPGFKIFQIEDKATWELGGSAVGNTFIMRGAFASPITTFTDETAYNSGWTMPGIANPYIFQHLPLYAQLQGFTFQYDAEHLLITVHESPSHVRSLYQKDAGSELLLHFNQFCFDLTDTITTPARKILLGMRPINQTACNNHYLRVRDEIQGAFRKFYGVTFDVPRPSVHVETWSIAKVENFAPIFRQLHEWGFPRAFIMPLWRSNETDMAPRFKEDQQRFGTLGNMCCPLEWEIADCYGGWDGLTALLSTAVELGVETYMWQGSNLSSSSPLGKSIKGIFAHDCSGQLDRNNYGHVLFSCDQSNPEYQDYYVSRAGKLKECGMTGIFRDSHFNMALDTLNYQHLQSNDEQGGATADQIGFLMRKPLEEQAMVRSMHDAEITGIHRRIQMELGMPYYVESSGLLGTPKCGTNYDWVRGCEFIWSNIETNMNPKRVLECGDSYEEAFFRGLSVRLFYQFQLDVNKFPAAESIEAWWNPQTMCPMLKAYLQVEAHLQQMWILDNDCGIRWSDSTGSNEVIFAYADFDYTANEKQLVIDVLSGEENVISAPIQMKAMRIYLLK